MQGTKDAKNDCMILLLFPRLMVALGAAYLCSLEIGYRVWKRWGGVGVYKRSRNGGMNECRGEV